MRSLFNIYLSRLFFLIFGLIILVYVLAFSIPALLIPAQGALIVLFVITFLDVLLVFSSKNPLYFERVHASRLNLGDENKISLHVVNKTKQPISFTLHEGFPVIMQERSQKFSALLLPTKQKVFNYSFVPKERGEFGFGSAFFIIASTFNLVSRKYIVEHESKMQVYPSVLQMKKYELLVFQQQRINVGIKKIRRLGNNSEFEQIKTYVQGDEVKTVNWKATSRRSELMVNQYQEEKSQHVFFVLDKSRPMQGDFNGLNLLDYAINTTLVMSNIAIKKGDKTGLITFSHKMGTQLPADGSSSQLRRIQEELYNQRTQFMEPNFDMLYQSIRKLAHTRSLIVLFTNFETEFSMRRALPLLRRINQKHVLVLVFFENEELNQLAYGPITTLHGVYQSTVAERMSAMKGRITKELQQNGIQTILTAPDQLSIKTINKYLELKAKGTI